MGPSSVPSSVTPNRCRSTGSVAVSRGGDTARSDERALVSQSSGDAGRRRNRRTVPPIVRYLTPTLAVGEIHWELYKDPMKTLTITDAKKNLGRWLDAAAKGEDIGIIAGADIIALRKVEVESTDYAQREYGATPAQVRAVDKATDTRYQRLKRSGKLVRASGQQLRQLE